MAKKREESRESGRSGQQRESGEPVSPTDDPQGDHAPSSAVDDAVEAFRLDEDADGDDAISALLAEAVALADTPESAGNDVDEVLDLDATADLDEDADVEVDLDEDPLEDDRVRGLGEVFDLDQTSDTDDVIDLDAAIDLDDPPGSHEVLGLGDVFDLDAASDTDEVIDLDTAIDSDDTPDSQKVRGLGDVVDVDGTDEAEEDDAFDLSAVIHPDDSADADEIIDLDEVFDVDPADNDRTAIDAASAIDHERLIAEALAFVASDDAARDAGSDEAGSASESQTVATPDSPAPISIPPDSPGPAAPIMSPAALAALSAMSSQGVTLPDELVLDLGEATTSDERDRLLSAALAHVEMQDAVYRVSSDVHRTTRVWKSVVASVLFVVAITVVFQPPGWVVPAPPVQLTEADQLHGVRVALLLQAQQIEAFRAKEERLPNSLAEIGITLPRVQFVKSNNRLYQLVARTPSGEPVLYDSAAPAPAFQQIEATWLTTAEGS